MKLAISRNTSTIAKGLFAVCIVLYHTNVYLFGESLQEISGTLMYISMFAFLFLSGYGCCCSYKKNGLDGYWEKKITKIYIPAVLSAIVGVLVRLAFGCGVDRTIIFNHVICLKPDDAFSKYLWYLHYLFFWYGAFWFIHKFVKNTKIRLAILGGVMLYMWFTAPEAGGFYRANTYGLGYGLGVYYAEIADKFKEVPRKPALYGVVILFAVIAMALAFNMNAYEVTIFGKKVNFWLQTMLYNAMWLAEMVMVLVICSVIGKLKVAKFFLWLGEISYCIYLLNCTLMQVPLSKLDGILNPWVVWIAGAAACLALGSLYTYKIAPVIEKK
jgi:peptidoglycan/LPS O-acetylase OafA/YrhL